MASLKSDSARATGQKMDLEGLRKLEFVPSFSETPWIHAKRPIWLHSPLSGECSHAGRFVEVPEASECGGINSCAL